MSGQECNPEPWINPLPIGASLWSPCTSDLSQNLCFRIEKLQKFNWRGVATVNFLSIVGMTDVKGKVFWKEANPGDFVFG